MFCSVNASACFETSVPAPGTVVIDLVAASKNMPNAFSAWSIVFSARSRSSAGTSSFGSIMVALLPFSELNTTLAGSPASVQAEEDVARRPALAGKRRARGKASAQAGSGQGVFGKGFFGGEVFDELDDLETLPGRELQKGAEQAQAFDSTACRRAELEVQLSCEIEVLHLVPMTSIGLRDPTSRSHLRTERHNRMPQPDATTGCHNRMPWRRRAFVRGSPVCSHAELHVQAGT